MITLQANMSQMSFADMANFCYPPYSGILHPTDKPFIVCIDVPGRYYDDVEGEYYEYIGKGLTGDQQMIRQYGNEQVRVHKEEGKSILLFQKDHNRQYNFVGVYEYFGHTWEKRCLKNPERLVIVFKLAKVSDVYTYDSRNNIGMVN